MMNNNRSQQKRNNPIPILFQNSQCVVFDKPAGLLTIPSPKGESRTLTSLVNDQYRNEEQQARLYPCHRLDKETSGAILFAWGKKNQQMLMEEFKKRSVKKKYIAIVQGKLKTSSGMIQGRIRSFDAKKFNKNKAKEAITKYNVVEQKRDFCIIEVEPVTGRSNQIRIHLKQLGHPVLGERKYAFGKDFKLKFKRTALHAAQLSFADPVSHKIINVQSPLPKDMEVFIARNTANRK